LEQLGAVYGGGYGVHGRKDRDSESLSQGLFVPIRNSRYLPAGGEKLIPLPGR
jgi:hypothetical protein